jgi:outer membrane protein OmpA-like peptidoglycan-associated protein
MRGPISQKRLPGLFDKTEEITTMKQMVMIVFIASFILGGCAASSTNTKINPTRSSVTGVEIGPETKGEVLGAVAGDEVAQEMMDEQETAMRDALADCESAVVKREGNVLTISLKTDAGFGTGSSNVHPEAYKELDQIARIMVDYPQTTIMIEGHTDNTGSETFNILLSERRANHIKHHFLQRGVSTKRIAVVGVGEARPIATNTTAQGRQMNRRVEIIIQPRS